MKLLRFHECPECHRISPYLQSRCDCGYRFSGRERQYKTCPECGSLIPSSQIICDCGHVMLRDRSQLTKADLETAYYAGLADGRARDAVKEDTELDRFFSEAGLRNSITGEPIRSPEDFFRWREAYDQACAGKTSASSSNSTCQKQRVPTQTRKKTKRFDRADKIVISVMAACILLAAGMEYFESAENKDPQPPTMETLSPDAYFTPVPISNGRIVKDPAAEQVAPLTVTAGSSQSCYVVLDPIDGQAENHMSFYVASGMTADVLVPLGEYAIYYATGDTWYGSGVLFGSSTSRYRCQDIFDFYDDGEYYQGWTLELYEQAYGNLDKELVGEDDWPE